jgi:geranylgeranyl diphosphate synthase type II
MWRTHAVYLAVIAVLILVIAVAATRQRRALEAEVAARIRSLVEFDPRPTAPRARPLPRWEAGADLASIRAAVDNLVYDAAMPDADFGSDLPLWEACAAAVEGGGRIRPIITMAVATAKSPAIDPSEAMLFVEYLHCASLVVDDMPSFDNDAERRGRPSVHAAFGAATAQMAVAALVAAALRNLCRQVDWVRRHDPAIRNPDRIGTRVCQEMCEALGASGAAGGQLAELTAGELSARKTAGFFELAAVTGWLIAGGSADRVAEVRELGTRVGAAFQIADDVRDVATDTQSVNYAAVRGVETARQDLQTHLAAARDQLASLSLESAIWDQLLDEIEDRAAS